VKTDIKYEHFIYLVLPIAAVQEERLSAAEKAEMEAESTTTGSEMPVDNILAAEMRTDARAESLHGGGAPDDLDTLPPFAIKLLTENLCTSLVDWAVAVPHFLELSNEDQTVLLKAGKDKAMSKLVLLLIQ